MKLNVYGQLIEVIRKDGNWTVFYLGNEGKKRLANDIRVPKEIRETELIEYITDLCHEWATPNNNKVKLLK